jgi:hypothetical protein
MKVEESPSNVLNAMKVELEPPLNSASSPVNGFEQLCLIS